MGEYTGNVGTIYTSEASNVGDDDKRWEAWFEDFHIIGLGHTELDALEDAARMVTDMSVLLVEAIAKVRAENTNHVVSEGG